MGSVYNIFKVGGAPLGYKHTLETLQKISESRKGELNSQWNVRRFGEENPFFGKTHSEKSRLAMSAAKGTSIFCLFS